jgi:hypothetical protein
MCHGNKKYFLGGVLSSAKIYQRKDVPRSASRIYDEEQLR